MPYCKRGKKARLIHMEGFGFERAYALAPVYAPRTEIIPLNACLFDDARALMADARAVLVLISPYAPYAQSAERGRGAMVSAYYMASHIAYRNARALADCLRNDGYSAIENARLPIKPLFTRFGLARVGVNGLMSLDGIGSYFNVQLVVTNAPLDATAPPEPAPVFRLDAACKNCRACVNACPTGALDGSGKVDLSKCLRALKENEVVSERVRPLIGDMLLGCDICQKVCPRNANISSAPMPELLDDVLNMRKLLEKNLGTLRLLVGTNFARTARIRARAALIAGNLMRADCIDALEKLAISGDEVTRAHARWALQRINGGGGL